VSGPLEELQPVKDPAAAVDEGELARLLGYPVGRRGGFEGRVAELVETARTWYAWHGRPWVAARRLAIRAIDGARVEVEAGETLRSERLAGWLHDAGAGELVVAVVTAGPEVDQRAAALWADDRPDEAYFADRFGAAVAEHLAAATAVTLRERYRSDGLALLPGYSPGYDGWPLEDQHPLFRLLRENPPLPVAPLSVEILDSGMLTPKSSLLAAFGLSPHPDRVEPLWRRGRCSWCSRSPCALRRGAPDGGDRLRSSSRA
jgi:hypothetical protein